MTDLQIVTDFYDSFIHQEANKMGDFYHPQAKFNDPAFGTLNSKEVKAMWQMLLESQQGKPFVVKVSDIKTANNLVIVHWQAAYIFSKTGRRVLNKVSSELEFKDGKIFRHNDTFNLYWWSCQALGILGYLLGWTPYFRKKLQGQTRRMLERYRSK